MVCRNWCFFYGVFWVFFLIGVFLFFFVCFFAVFFVCFFSKIKKKHLPDYHCFSVEKKKEIMNERFRVSSANLKAFKINKTY